MSDETPIAAPKVESKPIAGRKTTRKKSKAKKETKRDSHGGRPRLMSSYWLEVLKDKRLRGKDRADAIRELDKCLREEKQKKLSAMKPKPNGTLRAILGRDPKVGELKIEPQPVAEIARNAEVLKKVLKESPPAPEPETTETVEPASMTFDEMMEQLAEHNKQIRQETVGSIAKRLRDVPAPELDDNARRLIARAWSKVS
jgi:hypothetical protein